MPNLYPGTTAPNQASNPAATETRWQRFHVTANGYSVTALRWYRWSTSGGNVNRLRLINADTGATLYETPSFGGSAVGWYSFLIPPIAIQTGVNYALGLESPGGFWLSYSSLTPAPDAPLVADSTTFYVGTLGTNVSGTNVPNSLTYGDVVLTSTPGASVLSVVSQTDVSNLIVDHFGEGSTTRYPADTLSTVKATVDTVSSGVTATKGVADLIRTTQQGDSPKISDIWSVAGALTDFEYRVWNLLTHHTDTPATGQTAPATNPLYLADGRPISTAVQNHDSYLTDTRSAILAAIANILTQLRVPPQLPADPWTLIDTSDFDSELAWQQPADCYVFGVTTVPAGVSTTTWAGLSFHHRLGSWCVLNGSLGGTRRFLEFHQQLLDDGGRRMPGLALKCKPGTIGTVQAWQLAS